MQQETIAKTLTELFMLLARIGKDGEPPSDPESPAKTFEQTVGECPGCSAFVEADEIVENPLGLTIYFGDCSRCGLPVGCNPLSGLGRKGVFKVRLRGVGRGEHSLLRKTEQGGEA